MEAHVATDRAETDDMGDEEELDPRIQVELERLNAAGLCINKMSAELDEARAKFRSMLNDSTQKLNSMLRRNRKSIERARPFYEAKLHAKKVQQEAQQSAIQYQRATIEYRAAKETIELAEQRFLSCSEEEKREFDSAWQEMLNHATMKVMTSEKEKARSEQIHLQMAASFQAAEDKVHQLERKHRRSASKARPFFELKTQLEVKLQQQKQNVEDLQKTVKSSHVDYSEALKNLEQISEDIHTRRKSQMLLMTPREPGVGAETELPLPEIDFNTLEKCHSSMSMSSFPSDISEDDRNFDQSTEESDVFSQSEESGVFSLDSFDNDSLGRQDSFNKSRTKDCDIVNSGNVALKDGAVEMDVDILEEGMKQVTFDDEHELSCDRSSTQDELTAICGADDEIIDCDQKSSSKEDDIGDCDQNSPSKEDGGKTSEVCNEGSVCSDGSEKKESSSDENTDSSGDSSGCDDGDDEDEDIFHEFQKTEKAASF